MITLSLEQLRTICRKVWNISSEGNNGEYSYNIDEEIDANIEEVVEYELTNLIEKEEKK